ncbi:aldo/keto reductase, partial [Pseudomonas sp. MAFF212427]
PAQQAIAGYVALARELDVSPAQLALAAVIGKPFVSSALTGQTSLVQLRENLGALTLQLSPETLARIEQIHALIPNPAP